MSSLQRPSASFSRICDLRSVSVVFCRGCQQRGREVNAALAVAGLSDHLDIRPGRQQLRHAAAEQRVIVDEKMLPL
jgi:hypothetical protein